MKIMLVALLLQASVSFAQFNTQEDPNPFCEEQKARLLESIKQGFITCEAAKDFYAKIGCGELECK